MAGNIDPDVFKCYCVVSGYCRGSQRSSLLPVNLTAKSWSVNPSLRLHISGEEKWREYTTAVIPCHVNSNHSLLEWTELRVGAKCIKGDLDPEPRITFNSSVKVEVPMFLNPTERLEFGICTAVIYGHLDPYRLVEWLEMQRILGVGKIMIYNSSIGMRESHVLEHYRDEGVVEIHQIPPIMPTLKKESLTEINARQVIGLNDCLFRNMFGFRYLTALDTDEFILPQTAWNLSSLMEILRRRREQRHSGPSSLGFAQFITVDFLSEKGYQPQPDISKPWFSHFLRHRHGRLAHPVTLHLKFMIQPQACSALFVHYCWRRDPNFDSIYVDPGIAVLNHYRKDYCPSKRYFREMCASPDNRVLYDRILDYEQVLIQRVSAKLLDLGMYRDSVPQGTELL